MAEVVIAAGFVLPSSQAIILPTIVASEEIEQGEYAYLNIDGEWELAIAAAATPGGTQVLDTAGFALNHAYAGQPLAVVTEDLGGLQLESLSAPVPPLTPGESYYLSFNAGKIRPDDGSLGSSYRIFVGNALDEFRLAVWRVAGGQGT